MSLLFKSFFYILLHMKYNRCVVNGVFDLFHVGHVRLLKRAKEMFKEVIVAIDSDDFVTQTKRKPIFPQDARIEILKSCRYVDEVVIVDDIDGPAAKEADAVDKFMSRNNLDAIFLASDDMAYVNKWFKHLYDTNRTVIVPRTQGISTTQVIKIVNGEAV